MDSSQLKNLFINLEIIWIPLIMRIWNITHWLIKEKFNNEKKDWLFGISFLLQMKRKEIDSDWFSKCTSRYSLMSQLFTKREKQMINHTFPNKIKKFLENPTRFIRSFFSDKWSKLHWIWILLKGPLEIRNFEETEIFLLSFQCNTQYI